ncbi:DUF3305 domain-containing protein [Sulfitobacter aestuarii]|uniref:DUF3305 domain-containing protein n=1 Tax=Sulfitobacter aestuarii TaxID=2161676 RepID=A0ABW5U1W1_9RHOB
MSFVFPKAQSIPVGIVLRRAPGVTRWARHVWRAVALLPGAGPAEWKVLREVEGITEFHAATLPLTLFVSDTEAYLHELQAREPSLYAVLRPDDSRADIPWKAVLLTASPYEAQDYCDSDEALVEKLTMPEGMRAWIGDFVQRHHEEENFVKRRRDRLRVDRVEDGIGDPRIAQESDVYRAPGRRKAGQP